MSTPPPIDPFSPTDPRRGGHTWVQVEAALAQVSGQALGRYVGATPFVAPHISHDNPVCELMRAHPDAAPRCAAQCDHGLARTLDSRRTQLFQCHAKLSVFITPLAAEPGTDARLALIGGKVFQSYEDLDHFQRYARELSLDRAAIDAMAPNLRLFPVTEIKGFMEQARNIAEIVAASDHRSQTAQTQNNRLRYLMEIFGALEREAIDNVPEAALYALGILFNAPAALLLRHAVDTDTLHTSNCFINNANAFSESELSRLALDPTQAWVDAARSGKPSGDMSYVLHKVGFPGNTRSVALFPIGDDGPGSRLLALINTELSEFDRTAILAFCRHASVLLEQQSLSQRLASIDPSALDKDEAWDTTNPTDLAQLALNRAVAVTGAGSASVMLMDAQEQRLRVQAVHGIHMKFVEYVRVTPGEGIAGTVFSTGKPMLVQDIAQHPTLMANMRSRYTSGSFLSMPIRLGSKTFGVINVADKADADAFNHQDLNRLLSIAQHVALALDRVEILNTTEVLRKASMTDYLTGLLNRGAFDARMKEEVERAQRYPYGNPLSLLVVDIDDFKRINDRYGLLAGDDCIRFCAQTLQEGTRNIDSVYRRGGEEFTILLPHTSRDAALVLAQRLCQSMAALSVVSKHAPHPMEMTVSIGLATFPEDGETEDALFRRANQALHEAKGSGKNQAVTLPATPTA